MNAGEVMSTAHAAPTHDAAALRAANEDLRARVRRLQVLRDDPEELRRLQGDVDAQRAARLGAAADVEEKLEFVALQDGIARSRASCAGYRDALVATKARFERLLASYTTEVLPKMMLQEGSRSPTSPVRGPVAAAAAAAARTSLETKNVNGIDAMPKTRAKRRTVSPPGYGGLRVTHASSNGNSSLPVKPVAHEAQAAIAAHTLAAHRRREVSRTPQQTAPPRRSVSRSPQYAGYNGSNTSFGSAPGGRRIHVSPGLPKRKKSAPAQSADAA